MGANATQRAMMVRMTVRAAPGLEEHIANLGWWCEIAVDGTGGRAAAARGLAAAAERIGRIPHPEEPDEGLPNFIAVDERPEGPVLVFDIKDWGPDYAAEIVGILVESLGASGVDGLIGPPQRPPADEHDAGGVPAHVLASFDGERPVGFPAEFPEPPGASLRAATSTATDLEMLWGSSLDAPSVLTDLERRLPAAGFTVVASVEVLGAPAYTGVIAFDGVASGEVVVRQDDGSTYVEATVFLGALPARALAASLNDRKARAGLRFRIGG